MNNAVKIWDVKEQKYWDDEDGSDMVFANETTARNMMYVEGYTYEYMMTGVEFHPFNTILNDNSGYDLQ